MSFSENFKRARQDAGLTQQQVADALGLDRSAIARNMPLTITNKLHDRFTKFLMTV